jgi:hypothetical protein
MKGKRLSDRVEPYVVDALQAIGIDPDQTAVYWDEADMSDWRILVATPIGLLTYTHAEGDGRITYLTTLTSLTHWKDVHPAIKTVTERQRGAGPATFITRLEMELPEHLKEPIATRSGQDFDGVTEFVAECLRRVSAAR